jgi:hypothetical protein
MALGSRGLFLPFGNSVGWWKESFFFTRDGCKKLDCFDCVFHEAKMDHITGDSPDALSGGLAPCWSLEVYGTCRTVCVAKAQNKTSGY